jgi:hypothetical protein
MDTIIIEPAGQPAIIIEIEDVPDIIFEDVGMQGPPGPAGEVESGDGIRVVGEVVNIDINGLTLAP